MAYRCRQLGLVELMFNMSIILLYDSLQETPPLVDTLPITMHKCVVMQQWYFYKNRLTKANKYQQNYKQTIIP